MVDARPTDIRGLHQGAHRSDTADARFAEKKTRRELNFTARRPTSGAVVKI